MMKFKRVFHLTPRDAHMEMLTVEEIAKLMTPVKINPEELPAEFARKVLALLDDECSKTATEGGKS